MLRNHAGKDGKKITVALTVSPVKDSKGNVMGASTIARDETARKELEEQIKFQASHDSLTLLPTRTLFTEIFRVELSQARRDRRKIAGCSWTWTGSRKSTIRSGTSSATNS